MDKCCENCRHHKTRSYTDHSTNEEITESFCKCFHNPISDLKDTKDCTGFEWKKDYTFQLKQQIEELERALHEVNIQATNIYNYISCHKFVGPNPFDDYMSVKDIWHQIQDIRNTSTIEPTIYKIPEE